MAARPISYAGQPPGAPPPRPGGMVYPQPQPQPQPLYRPQQQPLLQQQPPLQHYQPRPLQHQQPRSAYSTPQQQYLPQHMPFQQLHGVASPRPQFVQRPGLMIAPSLPSMPIPQSQPQIQQQILLQQQRLQQQQQQLQQQMGPPYNPNNNIMVSSVAMPGVVNGGGVAAGPPFLLKTPSLGAAPSVSIAATTGLGGIRPVIMRPPGAFTASSPTMISSPGVARIPGTIIAPQRPVLIAAGPPSIIKQPSRTKTLLERPVPVIQIKQKTNTLLSDFWGDDMDVTKDGRVIDRSERDSSKSPNGNNNDSKQRVRQTGIVVGIDFGNTFTGVSYAHQGDGEMIDVVKWPRHLNAYAKVPTVSLYKTGDDKAFIDWGSSALSTYKRSKTGKVLIRDYKLLLFDQDARGKLENGLHLMDVITQYLKSVHRHLMEEVNKSQVRAAESVPIHYCITVPQAWTLPTRELMLRCYVEAGIILQTPALNMTVITEAEAAATYCRENCEEFEQLKDGDIFMICDAGGLTTTVTVFRVDDGLGVRQFVRMSNSHAENCGSVILDRLFRELILKKLEGLDIEDEAKPTRQKAFETLLEGFREIKSQFDGNSRDEVKHISVPMGLDIKDMDPPPPWLEDEYMSLKGQELCDLVFDPVIEMVQELVNAQSKTHPVCAGLFMVGGFGANKYLLHKLESAAEKSRSKSTGSVIKKVVMVQKAELAVARGAVIYGLKSASQYTKAFL
ncbi:hypothetical protein BCR41DRAFT_389910 [Lobosporangium transversale]|uniref:Actin-like ATPase domain-containing protein n=1 Tax=Lobosporangium transversale TaxID=64571 RepID=A0A1Y2G918_9FUNG|nr:hypothetical protein BCR41DRAFT_389910 [Lobosporangium transversale]ORZ04551.1 hypothetical protein BCR41DRAFT_389910 [Lobosporangium transversale]|eukprot:XP_021876597.1 hypothetical protein BCR41DRAFT_389910 [Lobosporangium transversale]